MEYVRCMNSFHDDPAMPHLSLFGISFQLYATPSTPKIITNASFSSISILKDYTILIDLMETIAFT